MIELPFAPTNVKAIRHDTPMYRSINISWTPGFDGNSKILKFIIQRREVPELGNYFTHFALYAKQTKTLITHEGGNYVNTCRIQL